MCVRREEEEGDEDEGRVRDTINKRSGFPNRAESALMT